MAFFDGQRLSFDGNLCTVRYHGPLEATRGDWLGVEWDDTTRGKHNGTYKGRKIFSCLSPSPTAASFVRPSRKSDRTRTVLEAIRDKYEQTNRANGDLFGPGYEIIEISKKKVEEIGFDKIKQQMSQLQNLKVAILDQLGVTAVTKLPAADHQVKAAQNELVAVCPSISELDLGWNPIETWQDVIDICAPLQNLRILKASGLRFRSCTAGQDLSRVVELHLNECLLNPSQILDLLTQQNKPTFPNLKTLWLSQNGLSSFNVDNTSRIFHSMKSLVLENNKFTDLAQVARVCQHFPNVEYLSLQGNLINTTGTKSILSSTLTALNLASNDISDFTFVDCLPEIFPNLSSLRISRNPLYDRPAHATPSTTSEQTSTPTNSNKPSDAPFYLTIARIPNLKLLNYTSVTPRDREEGEIYYLSLADKDIRSTLSSRPHKGESQHDLITALTTRYPRYSEFTTKYDRPNLLLASTDPTLLTGPTPSASIDFAANASLASRLIVATFYLAASRDTHINSTTPPGKHDLVRPIPTTTPVYTLKSLLAKSFNLPPLQFKLVYESEELDPEQVTTTKLWGSSAEEWLEWGRWDADLSGVSFPNGGGGADAATMTPRLGGSGDVQENGEQDHEARDGDGQWIDDGRVLLKGGTRWRKREVEISDGWRGWGDYLDGGVREVRVRVEPLELKS